MAWWNGLFGGNGTTNATIGVVGPGFGFTSELMQLLGADIQPGSPLDYETAKIIYSAHPLGKKIADTVVQMAMAKPREISILDEMDGPVVKQFVKTWEEMKIDPVIFSAKSQSRIYGASGIGIVSKGWNPMAPLTEKEMTDRDLEFNVWDPLNLAGSLTTNQDPNAVDYQKTVASTASGVEYHKSRTCIILNEAPLYILYTVSSFGYVGRSVYQRALFPLKVHLQTMQTNNWVSLKAALLITKLKAGGSVTDNLMAQSAQQKRLMIQAGITGNVLSMAVDESADTLNMQNLDGAAKFARDSNLDDISSACDLHPWFLSNDSLAQGFGEGTEDANAIAANVERVRNEMTPIYKFFDPIVMRKALTQEFFETVKAEQPDRYDGMSYEEAYYKWANSFTATWPNVIQESNEKKAKAAKAVVDGVKAVAEVLLPICDPENKARVTTWVADTINSQQDFFPVPLVIDQDALAAYVPPAPVAQEEEPKPDSEPDDMPSSEPKPRRTKKSRLAPYSGAELAADMV